MKPFIWQISVFNFTKSITVFWNDGSKIKYMNMLYRLYFKVHYDEKNVYEYLNKVKSSQPSLHETWDKR